MSTKGQVCQRSFSCLEKQDIVESAPTAEGNRAGSREEVPPCVPALSTTPPKSIMWNAELDTDPAYSPNICNLGRARPKPSARNSIQVHMGGKNPSTWTITYLPGSFIRKLNWKWRDLNCYSYMQCDCPKPWVTLSFQNIHPVLPS